MIWPLLVHLLFPLTLRLAVCATFILAWSNSLAQSVTTQVLGTVKDASGSILSGVGVKLIDAGTQREKTTITDPAGAFVFPEVASGYYTVAAEALGYHKAEVANVKVDVGVPTTVNITLTLGDVLVTIRTEAREAQATVNTVNAELQTTVQERQINDLPLNGRFPLQLADLQAGVATNGNWRDASVNGLRGTFTNLTWDGININDNFIRTDSFFAIAAPSVPGVSEFTLTTQNGGPSDGAGIAQVKLVTPRGGSAYHGSLFEFHRNDLFDANSWFNNATVDRATGKALPKEKLVRNQFGFNLGGPVRLPRKVFGPLGFDNSKLFFYTYYEGTRERSEVSFLRTAFTAAARQGLFTYRRVDTGELRTVNLLTLSGVTPDPKTQSLIALTPLPNDFTFGDLGGSPEAARLSNTAGFRFNTPSGNDGDLWGFRIDFNPDERHKFEAIFSRFDYHLPNDAFNDLGEPFPGLPGAGQRFPRQRGSFAWHWTPTQNLSHELRGGFNSYTLEFFTSEKFPGGYQISFPVITNPVNNFLPQGRNVLNYELIDHTSWVKGNHQVRFGGNLRWDPIKFFNNYGTLPQYSLYFNGRGNPNPLNFEQFPGVSFNDFNRASSLLAALGGFVGQASQVFNVTSRNSGFVSGAGERRRIDYHTLGLYGGDTWRLKPNFTLNLGWRWEFISVPTEKNGLGLLPVGGLQALFDPRAVLDFAGSGTGRMFFNHDLNNFAPHLSFSWDPFGAGKTAIRAGYAISYVIDNNVTTVLNAALRANEGLQATSTVNAVSGTVSRGGLVPIPAPTFKVPRTILDNVELNPVTVLFTIDPNLRTPYVQQWTLSVERELLPDTVFEARYVGNRGVKLTRGIDINQVRIFDTRCSSFYLGRMV